MRRPTRYVRVKLTYYEATAYWLAAGNTLQSREAAEAVLGKGVRGLSSVAAARRAHTKLERAWRKVQESASE